MSRIRLRSILVFALAVALLLASCRQAVADPQEPEPPELYETITAPAQQEPVLPEPEDGTTDEPEEAEEPHEPVHIWEPWETQDMEWPELFAALIHRFGEETIRDPHFFWEWWWVDSPWFALMDLSGDGQLELLFGSPSINISGMFYAVSAAEAEQFLLTETEDWNWPRMVSGEHPLRFFINESTGERIFSTVASTAGGGFADNIFYTEAQTGERRWRIVCFNYGRHTVSSHVHRLDEWGEDGWTERTVLEALPLDWQEWWEARGNESGVAEVRPCDLFYGRNSSDPSTVALVNIVLEGFTEIPAPAMHRFGEFNWDDLSSADDVQALQDWIFEVAALWQRG